MERRKLVEVVVERRKLVELVVERRKLVEVVGERCELGGGGREARAARWRWWRGARWWCR